MYLMYVNSNSKFIRLCGIVMYCIYIYMRVYVSWPSGGKHLGG